MHNKLIAEGFGTFILTLVVHATTYQASVIPTAILAALVVVLFVFTIGERSGAHLNPAITLGLLTIKKIDRRLASFYVGAQLIGALLATLLAVAIFGGALAFTIAPESLTVFLAEAVGAVLFGFGVAAVVYDRVPKPVFGPVIGGSLLVGLMLAASLGATGILNPAVALSMGAVDLSHVFGPIVGAILGMNLYKRFIA